MWGTISKDSMELLTRDVLTKNKDSLQITYVQKDPQEFEQNLVEAIANGVGPDIVILPQDMILKNLNKFTTISYTTYPLRTFKDKFIDAGSVFLKDDGIIAIPFVVDPMVMYWNKTHFVNAGIVNSPKDWDEFSQDVIKLTKKDSNFNVFQSGTALGVYENVDHSKDILSMLFIQAGVPIVSKNKDGYFATFSNDSVGGGNNTAVSALSFYTDFANPSKDVYSWNKSLKTSFNSFVSGETSMYLGYASELASIPFKNPNLNFDVSKVPQVPNGNKKSVFAKIYGLAILKSSKNQMSSFNQINTLTSQDSITTLSSLTSLPPVRRDVLANKPTDQYMQIFYDSALWADTWLDPDQVATDAVFKDMVNSVIVGSAVPAVVISNVGNKMQKIISQSVIKI